MKCGIWVVVGLIASLSPAIAQETRAIAPVPAPIIDPTENVKALSEAANKRQDDLREAFEKLVNARLEGVAALAKFSIDATVSERNAEIRRLDSEARLRAEFNEKQQTAESKRIDAIRAVDVNAVAVASTRATDQASVLATQVSQSAEALRALVATTAATVATSQQQLANTLSARLTTLEQAGYQNQGKSTVQDPAFQELLKQVTALTQAQNNGVGVTAGRSDVAGWVFGGIMFLIALAGAAAAFMRKK
jgi:hypothetical protein